MITLRVKKAIDKSSVLWLFLITILFIALGFYVMNMPSSKLTDNFKITEYQLISWEKLIHPEDLYARLNPPIWLAVINDAFDDKADDLTNPEVEPVSMDRYEEAQASIRVNPSLDGKAISIPAYIVPLEFNEKMHITEFFMVPFYGACLHLPPPPPNQLVHVTYPIGHKFESQNQELLESSNHAVMVSGVLKAIKLENDIASASYIMDVHNLEVYISP